MRGDDLLYVSDIGTSDVYVYSYRSGKLRETLTGFQSPHGECVDKTGDVFVTNTRASDILEYPHGGTVAIATLQDPGQYPTGCSVDLKTGRLAVANSDGTGSSQAPGDVVIYKHAKGTPKAYSDPSIVTYTSCGYDDKGNLYIDGLSANGEFKFAELPAGSKTLTDVTLNQQINVPGGVQWDGKYVAVEDQGMGYSGSTIYQFTISGSTGTEVGTTVLDGSTDAIKFWKQGHRVVAPNLGNKNVMYWTYPAGGAALKTISGFSEPVAVTVSLAK